MTYRLNRKAEEDIIGIYRYTVETFGHGQADVYHRKLETAFRLLSDHPHIAPERHEIDPPVRVYPCGSHIIVYLAPPGETVLILRVRHAREDWVSEFRVAERLMGKTDGGDGKPVPVASRGGAMSSRTAGVRMRPECGPRAVAQLESACRSSLDPRLRRFPPPSSGPKPGP